MQRRKTRELFIGSIGIGSDHPISIQSMTNTDTRDASATLAQIHALAQAGCDIVRVTVPDNEAAEALKEICAQSPVPIVADIHFDYKLALSAMEAGVDGLRINPGNIGSRANVEAVVKMAKEKNIPIRIGVNSGSVPKDILAKYGGHPTAEALVESAMRHGENPRRIGFSQY